MKTNFKKLLLATLASGFGMWFIGGLWHNLVLPIINSNVQAHHDGLGITLIAYFILALPMAYLFPYYFQKKNHIIQGLIFGVIIGFIWVFPHGLAMAGTHDTSILYEIKNGIYHLVEQGIGGVIVALVYGKRIISKD